MTFRGGVDAAMRLRIRRIADQRAVLACVAIALLFAQLSYAQTQRCSPLVGRIVSIQGDVRLLRAGAAAWVAVKRLDTALCQGDQLRTGLLSRAGV
ncbi:MAG TPA: hypothetical protein VFA81_03255, partial [Burkholderiales bacterium]|nr:hypothetical protein [Burkholderiales bacterium]